MIAGPGFFSSFVDSISPASTDLLYVPFTDGTAADITESPSPYHFEGVAAPNFSNGVYGINSSSRIVWTASKLNQIADSAYTLEFDTNWQNLANVSENLLLAFVNGGNNFSQHRIYYSGQNGYIIWRYGTSSEIILGQISSSNTVRTHIALVREQNNSGRIYFNGSLVYSGDIPDIGGTNNYLMAGRNSDQGVNNYTIDNIRLRLGSNYYTGSTITPPTY